LIGAELIKHRDKFTFSLLTISIRGLFNKKT
jgi:hypothetical protein